MVQNPLAASQQVQVAVGADTSGYVGALDEASAVTGGFRGSLSKLGTVLVAGGAAAGLGIAAALGKSAAAAADFEEAMVGVEKVTSEATAEALSGTLQEMSEEIPKTQGELAGIAETAGRLGVEGSENIKTFTRTVAEISTATDLATDSAADSFARIATLTEEPTSNIRSLGDVVNRLSNNMAASAQEITDSMTRASGTLTQLGLSTTEISGLTAAMNEVSASSRRAGTQLRRLGQELQTVEAGKLAEPLGMTVEEFERMRDESPNELIRTMAAAMGDGGEAADALRAALSTTSRQAVAGLAQNLDSLQEAQSNANEEMENGGSLTEEFEAANSTFNAQLQRVQNQLRNVGIEIGEEVLPYLSDFLTLVSDGVDDVQSFIETTDRLEGSMDGIGESVKRAGQTARQAVNGDWQTALDELESTYQDGMTNMSTVLVGRGGSGGPLNEMVERGSDWLEANGPTILQEGADTLVETTGARLGALKHILIGPSGESGILSTAVDEGSAFLKNTGPEIIGEGAEMLGEGIRWGLKDLSKALTDGEESVIYSNLMDVRKWLRANGWQLLKAGGVALKDGLIAGFSGLVRGLIGAEDGEISQAIDDIIAYLQSTPSRFSDAVTGWGAAVAGDIRSEVNDELGLPFEIGELSVGGDTITKGQTVIPALAQGGIVTEPTMAMVGEGRQSEAVVPLDKLERMLSQSGGGVQQVEVVVRSEDEKFDAEVREISRDEFAAQGELAFEQQRRLEDRS
ncbi:phage tail tape measure protein [Halobacterium hubeiense]|uniref:phage tail tape measure protein n=1 Tax=Halobacterium hubeiense TaxID=1407499 RepID=UPI000B7DB506|nr:phage tail tape measure protein [Halobacterium hubeiense]